MSRSAKPSLKQCRILVTNDDGVYAPGIKVLEKVAKTLSDDVWVVAPLVEQSAAAHSLTIRRPLQISRISPRRFAIDGTPTDCVLLALNHILAEQPPHLVLSGVNRGGNLGEDVTYSGTIAAAMEATLLGVPAMAFSLMRNGSANLLWHTAEHHAPGIIRTLWQQNWQENVLFNVNFPHCTAEEVTGIKMARQGRRVEKIRVVPIKDPVGRDYVWIGDFLSDEALAHGTDLAAIGERAISVTPLHVDLTHEPSLKRLKGLFS